MIELNHQLASTADPPEGSGQAAAVPPIPLGEFAGMGRAERAARFLELCAEACQSGDFVQIGRELIHRILGEDHQAGAAGPPLPVQGQVVRYLPADGEEEEPAMVTRVHSEFTLSLRVMPAHGNTYSRRLVQKVGSQHRGEAAWDFIPSLQSQI